MNWAGEQPRQEMVEVHRAAGLALLRGHWVCQRGDVGNDGENAMLAVFWHTLPKLANVHVVSL